MSMSVRAFASSSLGSRWFPPWTPNRVDPLLLCGSYCEVLAEESKCQPHHHEGSRRCPWWMATAHAAGSRSSPLGERRSLFRTVNTRLDGAFETAPDLSSVPLFPATRGGLSGPQGTGVLVNDWFRGLPNPMARLAHIRSWVVGLRLFVLLAGSFSVVAAQGRGWWNRVPPRFAEPNTPSNDLFSFCRILYESVRREPSGDGWDTDYPYSDINFMTRFSRN